MPKRKTIRTGVLSILKPDYEYLQKVFQETAVVASFLRRQASLLINTYLNQDDAHLPVNNLQSFYEYAQGLFLADFRPREYALTPEKSVLRNVFETVFAPSFTSSDNLQGIEKPTICPTQLRGFNARQMIANHKAQIYTHFHKYQYGTIKAEVERYIPEILTTSQRQTHVKKISFFISRRINQLVFVADLERYQSYADAHSGAHSDQLWQEAISTTTLAPPSIFEVHGTEDETQGGEEEQQQEDIHLDDVDDSDSDDSDSDDDKGGDDDNNEIEQLTMAAGERLARQYISENILSGYIASHRRSLGFLLIVSVAGDRRKRRLSRLVLRNKGSIAGITTYFKFLRACRQTLDCRRFQLFPEYKMVTKYFKIDERVLEFLCRPQVAQAFNVTTKVNGPSGQREINRDIWEQVFHFDSIGISNMPEHISISTDGYGCCVSVGGGRSSPAEPENDDEDSAGEGTSRAVPRKRKRKPSRKRRKNEKKDISNTTKGHFRLEKVTSESLAAIMTGANLIGVDHGMKSLVTAVRSDNPIDNVQLTAGYWKNVRLTRAFERKEQGVRQRSQAVAPLTQLSTLRRDTYDEWVTYIHQYYDNFEVLHAWSKLPFYRRWRRSREIRIESAMAGMKNAILSPHSRLPPIKPVAATGPVTPRPIYQEQDVPKVVAWGNGNFGNRKGSPPLPNKGLCKYVARFCHVIKIPEFRTSITCPCNNRTVEHQIPALGIICEHLKRKKYERRLDTKHWVKRSKWCCLREEGDLHFLHPFRDCPDLHEELNLRVIRHRVCPHCAEQYANSSLRNHELPWTVYLADICQRRRIDHQPVWHKDIMAAFNMRRIVQHYAANGTRPAWNLPDRHRVL